MTESSNPCLVACLGQSGVRLQFDDSVIYIDPYLSNSVRELDNTEFERLRPIPVSPDDVKDAEFILITHEHLDHCDPFTVPRIAKASPECRIVCPNAVRRILIDLDIPPSRIIIASESRIQLREGLTVLPIPAAHPDLEVDQEGNWRFVGYVVEHSERRFYHAGDTAVHAKIVESLLDIGGIDVAFLPVNEQSYYRAKMGIIGNMSVRDAFSFGEEIGAAVVVPMHWDMFSANQTYREEVELLYERIHPRFDLQFEPTEL